MEGWTLHKAGTRVRTADPLVRRDYLPSAVKLRKPGVSGTIESHSDSHGLCYLVRHEKDGLAAYYDIEELLDEDGNPLLNAMVVLETMTT